LIAHTRNNFRSGAVVPTPLRKASIGAEKRGSHPARRVLAEISTKYRLSARKNAPILVALRKCTCMLLLHNQGAYTVQ